MFVPKNKEARAGFLSTEEYGQKWKPTSGSVGRCGDSHKANDDEGTEHSRSEHIHLPVAPSLSTRHDANVVTRPGNNSNIYQTKMVCRIAVYCDWSFESNFFFGIALLWLIHIDAILGRGTALYCFGPVQAAFLRKMLCFSLLLVLYLLGRTENSIVIIDCSKQIEQWFFDRSANRVTFVE